MGGSQSATAVGGIEVAAESPQEGSCIVEFKIVDSKGQPVGTLETDMGIRLSNPVAGKANSGGKEYLSATVTFADFGTGTSLWRKGKVASAKASPVSTLKL